MIRIIGIVLLVACASPPPEPSREPWTPTRHDYAVFRDGHPGLADPNYLPFMAHRFAFPEGSEDWLVLCRWDDHRFPLAVHIEPPLISEELQNEFRPVESTVYVRAVEHALHSWEEMLPDIVEFERTEDAGAADLRIRMIGAVGPAPNPDVQVLGVTPIARACHIRGGDPTSGRLEVDFEVGEVAIYVADRFGLLTDDQVDRITLHELGHALGMRGHSPIPADVMYEVARDRTVGRLSSEDVNSFRTLYGLPNGTVYSHLPVGAALERPLPRAPTGPPELTDEPHRDERLGFAVRLARGWLQIPTTYGIVAVDGVAWDYEASFQLIVRTYPTIEAYLERYGASHVGRGWIKRQEDLEVVGLQAHRMFVEQHESSLVEQHTFIETGDGRLVVAIADSAAELYDDFEPWFESMLSSLEVFTAQGPH